MSSRPNAFHADDTPVPVLAKGKTRSVGPICVTTDHSAAMIGRPPCSSIRAAATASIPNGLRPTDASGCLCGDSTGCMNSTVSRVDHRSRVPGGCAAVWQGHRLGLPLIEAQQTWLCERRSKLSGRERALQGD
jgi:hypothetical protein